MTRGDEIVRGTSLAALFARGELDRVLALHLRSAARADDDRAAVVGAYAWTGRLDEAQAQHAAFSRRATAGYREVARCWLVVGLCHAGRLAAARRLARSADDDPALPADSPLRFYRRYARAFVAYFAGRMEACRRAARRALRAAVAGELPFGQLLAHDLLAHATFALGGLREARRLLATAIRVAADLNLVGNRLNLMVTEGVFAVTADPRDDGAVTALAALLHHDELRYFARRHGHAALAIAAALRGDLAGARAHMAAADAAAVGDDPRAGVRAGLARACLAAVSGERTTAAAELTTALDLALRRRHLDLVAEAGFLHRLLLGQALAPVPARLERADAVRLAWARGGEAAPADGAGGDALFALACRLAGAPPTAWAERGLVGLAALSLPAGDVIGVVGDAMVLRSGAAVTYRPAGTELAGRILAALAGGPRSKAVLVRALWGVRTYHPRLHDGTLYTAVSRLRRAWGAQGSWLETTLEGYRLRPGVQVVALPAEPGPDAVDEPAEPLPTAAGPLPAPAARPATLDERLVAAATAGPLTCAEAARAAGVSPSTALRGLRTLVAAGRLTRVGRGAGTRYAIGS